MQKNIQLPQVELTMDNVTVVGWLIKVGDRVEPDQNVLEVESQKGVVEVPTPEGGIVRKLCVVKGDEIAEKALICILTNTVEETFEEKVGRASSLSPAREMAGSKAVDRQDACPTLGQPVKAAPAARKLAKDRGIELATVPGTGPGGRITVADVEGASGDGKLSGARLALIAQMQKALTEIPQFNLTRQLDVTPLMCKAAGITFTHRLVKAVGGALAVHPALRTIINGDRVREAAVSVAVAIDSTHGLVAPAIRDADQLTVEQIAERLNDLRERAAAGQVKREELIDTPFAITNLGMLGVDIFTPFVFHGQTAVLAIGRAVEGKAWFTLAADHRVVDGAEGARFLETLQQQILARESHE